MALPPTWGAMGGVEALVEKRVDNVEDDASEDKRGLGEAECDGAGPYAGSAKKIY